MLIIIMINQKFRWINFEKTNSHCGTSIFRILFAGTLPSSPPGDAGDAGDDAGDGCGWWWPECDIKHH